MSRFLSKGFTLVELMIVLAIIGLIAWALFPTITSYISRGRDVTRISDIKELSARFQNYMHDWEAYPDNTNSFGVTSYCVTDVMLWDNATSSIIDRQYQILGGRAALRVDPTSNNPNIWLCTLNGSYFYSRIDRNWSFAVLAARMENQTTWANWTGALLMTSSWYIDDMQKSAPLDKSANDPDKIFLLITN